jgi:hypothetical protein
MISPAKDDTREWPSNLEEVEGQAHISKDGWVVRAKCDWHAIVDKDREWMHRHRGCQTLME